MENYEELTLLNEGSYGTVHLVQDKLTGVKYAAKRISLEHSRKDDIETEIRVHNLVGDHPNVVGIYDDFLTDDGKEHVLILEYCAGGDVHDILAKGVRPSPHEIKKVILELVDVIAYSHSRGVYHRDLKPENIFIDGKNTMRLGDWGLATTEKQCREFDTGSDQYMAPECFKSGASSYDAEQADVWALGVVLLNIVFGRTPFKQATPRDALFRDFCVSRAALYRIFPNISPELFQALRLALAVNPAHRSLAKFREALAAVTSWTAENEFTMIHKTVSPVPNGSSFSPSSPPSPSSPTGTSLFAIAQQQLNRTKAQFVPVVHKPLRVPTSVAQSLRTPPISPKWDLANMYTPTDRVPSPLRSHPAWSDLEQLDEADFEEDEELLESETSDLTSEDDALVLGELEVDEPLHGYSKMLDRAPATLAEL